MRDIGVASGHEDARSDAAADARFADDNDTAVARDSLKAAAKAFVARSGSLVDGMPAPVDAPLVVIGGAATYQARCRHHHRIGVAARPEPEAVPVADESAEL